MPKPKQNRVYDLSISSVMEQIDERLSDFLTDDLLIGIPARVVKDSDYESDQTVDVQPVLDSKLIDDRVLTAPVIKKVFVKLPSGGDFSILIPIKIGDLVTLHYSHKAISSWLDGEGDQLTQSSRFIAQDRDCWVTHGFGTRKVNQSPSQTDFIIKGPKTTFTFDPTGAVTLDTEADVLVKTTGNSKIESVTHTVAANMIVEGTLTVQQDVDFEMNLEVTDVITADSGDYTTSLQIDSKELKGHDHAINSGSSSPGPTGPNN